MLNKKKKFTLLHTSIDWKKIFNQKNENNSLHIMQYYIDDGYEVPIVMICEDINQFLVSKRQMCTYLLTFNAIKPIFGNF